MKHLFKYLSKLLFVLSIFILQINFSSALDVCPGQTANLTWSITSGAVTACNTKTSDNSQCPFSGSDGNGGSKNVSLPSGNCTVNFQCTNASGLSNLGSASLNVVNNSGCCNINPALAEGRTFWNGSSCVVPAVAVAGVCGSTANACTAGTLGVNNIQGNGDYHWYCNGTNGGTTSPLCFYVPPPAVVTWTRYCTPIGDANPNQFW